MIECSSLDFQKIIHQTEVSKVLVYYFFFFNKVWFQRTPWALFCFASIFNFLAITFWCPFISYDTCWENLVSCAVSKNISSLGCVYFIRMQRQLQNKMPVFLLQEKKASEERVEDQKAVDDQVLPEISKIPQLRKYMKSLFSLRKGQYPHSMKF